MFVVMRCAAGKWRTTTRRERSCCVRTVERTASCSAAQPVSVYRKRTDQMRDVMLYFGMGKKIFS